MPDIKTLDLNLLKALDALLDERHVTRAAERLSVSQPAMSGMLTRLRDSFGDPLFIRSQYGIVPTERALALAPTVKQVLEDITSLLNIPEFDPATAEMNITIAATDYAMYAVAAPFLAALKPRAPHIRVAVIQINDRRVHEELEQGRLDFALITPEHAHEGLHIRPLFEEHYVCALRQDHPAVTGGKLTLDQFCTLEQALVSYHGGGFSGVTDQTLAKLDRSRRVGLSVQSFLILPEILRNSDLLAVVPYRLVAQLPDIVHFKPPIEIPGFTKVLAWHERTHRHPAHRWLRDLMYESCHGVV